MESNNLISYISVLFEIDTDYWSENISSSTAEPFSLILPPFSLYPLLTVMELF